MKETEAETDTDAKFGVQLYSQRPGDLSQIGCKSKMADVYLINLLQLLIMRRRRRRELACQRQPRTFWIREMFLKRKTHGQFENLVKEIRLNDRETFFR